MALGLCISYVAADVEPGLGETTKNWRYILFLCVGN